jgi:hypothetical protein
MTEERRVRVSDPAATLVRVENIDEVQRKYHGRCHWMTHERAARGEARGLWKIIKEEESR